MDSTDKETTTKGSASKGSASNGAEGNEATGKGVAGKGGAGKGRPTPKRKEAQKKNERPLILDKKAAKARSREQRNKRFQREQDALMGVGDKRYLPFEHQGDDRKFMRDYIDSRWTISEFALPIMLVLIIIAFIGPISTKDPLVAYYFQAIPVYGVWAVLLIIIGEIVFYVRKINGILRRRRGDKFFKRGNGRYIAYRMTTIRRGRRPVCEVKRGTIPFNPEK